MYKKGGRRAPWKTQPQAQSTQAHDQSQQRLSLVSLSVPRSYTPAIMPRLTTAAAGLSWAILLVCVTLVVGQAQPQANLAAWFPSGSLPPPVRIYSRQNDALNVAIRDGNVVFARAAFSDDSQARFFYPYPSFTIHGYTNAHATLL